MLAMKETLGLGGPRPLPIGCLAYAVIGRGPERDFLFGPVSTEPERAIESSTRFAQSIRLPSRMQSSVARIQL